MDTVLMLLGSVVAASGTVPYIVAVAKHQTKPRIVTWLTWALLTGLAAAAAFSDHQLGGGFFALLGAFSTAAVVIAGLRYGDRSFGKLDIACQAAVIIGLILWLSLHNPAIGVWVAIIIDFVGLIPTLKHAWQAPNEETASTYALVGIGAIITIGATLLSGSHSVTAIGYPIYAGSSLGSLALLLVARRRLIRAPQSAVEPLETES